MKIVYTNLREDSCGVKRSVRQVQLDFGKGQNGQISLRRGGPEGENEDRRGASLDDSDLQARRRPIDGGLRGRDREGAVSPGDGEERRFFQGALVITSLAGCYIRRFLEAQMMTACRMDEGNRINVFV